MLLSYFFFVNSLTPFSICKTVTAEKQGVWIGPTFLFPHINLAWGHLFNTSYGKDRQRIKVERGDCSDQCRAPWRSEVSLQDWDSFSQFCKQSQVLYHVGKGILFIAVITNCHKLSSLEHFPSYNSVG